MSTDDIDYWDNEALSDPRYAAARWGMNGFKDADETIERILAILVRGMPLDIERVLEIGCGPGRLLCRLAQMYRDFSFWGVDISPEMRSLCAANMQDRGLKYPYVRVFDPFYRAPGDDRSKDSLCHIEQDFVYCVELFQHLPDNEVESYIRQAKQVLRPGGKFIAQFVTRGEPGPHSFPRDEDAIGSMFMDAGFEFVSGKYAVHPDWLWVTATKAS